MPSRVFFHLIINITINVNSHDPVSLLISRTRCMRYEYVSRKLSINIHLIKTNIISNINIARVYVILY